MAKKVLACTVGHHGSWTAFEGLFPTLLPLCMSLYEPSEMPSMWAFMYRARVIRHLWEASSLRSSPLPFSSPVPQNPHFSSFHAVESAWEANLV